MSDSESDRYDEGSDEGFSEEETARRVPKSKTAPAKKVTTAAPLQPSAKANAGPGRTIEETYQKKTQLEHVLLRPDTYIGSIQVHTSSLWVYEEGKMVNREVSYVPGLYKIFDEILVNAADNKQRDQSMDSLKVTIDPEKNLISVWNNGKGVPIEMHAKEKVYVPELIFGHLLTSSNYDDSEKKTTGGRNGFGAKLANIYSTEFTVETADRSKKYKQVFWNNMSKKGEPTITTLKKTENWTCISYKPDLARFKMERLDQDIVALMSKRVVDIAGCLGKTVKVELNGTKIPVKTFQEYANLYLEATKNPEKDEPMPRIYERINESWEICVSITDGQFQQVSFVNSIATIKGGTHVALVTDQVAKYVFAKVQKKLGKHASNLKLHQVKNHLWVFVNSLIVNPAFDSQTKETLNTRVSDFGSTCKIPEEFLKKVATKTGIVETLLSFATFKANKDMKKSDGSKKQRLTGISKLDDANDAGGKHSDECTLILTEGDSAKALAISGLSVVGRNKYGVFPLRGKLLNVRDASSKQITENAEITHIKQIMGLQQGKSYDSTKSLRYGHLMIMTDQDHDGSHIKGLIINFLHAFWPSLLKQPNFLLEFITPIVKASGPRGQVLSFYTIPEYESWKESLGGTSKGWSIKYYKGLGTSTPKEAKEYFAALDRHKIEFEWVGNQDGDCIDMAFSKKKVEDRKQWLRNFEPGTFLDQAVDRISYSDFVNKELVLYSMADNARSIPSVMDGLKPGQRKIIFSCFKRKLKNDVKVAQLAGYISEHSAYHHGEQSLMSTIIGLAQDYVGSNNLNLLVPSGQFGTRLQGGKDAASARYIYTRLHTLTRILFPESDDALLDFLNEDGQKIEPQWYMPILPMVLVNGSEGIGTGWSSSVPTYNPRDIVENLKRKIRGEALNPMHPWYRGFQGSIRASKVAEDGRILSYTVTGIIEKKSDTTLEITELPISKWTQDYKEFLEPMLMKGDKGGEPLLKEMREHHTDTSVHFELELSPEAMATVEAEGLLKRFKLSTSVSTSNMTLFDKDGRIMSFESPEQILEYFFSIRLEYYGKRKESIMESLRFDLLRLDHKVRFILAVIAGEIIVNNRKKAELLQELKAKNYPTLPKAGGPVKGASTAAEDAETSDGAEEITDNSAEARSASYEYLLGMPLWSLTLERVQQLLKEQDQKKSDLEELVGTSPEQLWKRDLNNFLQHLEEVEVFEAEERSKSAKLSKSKGGKRKGLQKKAAGKSELKKASSETDDDLAFESGDSDFEVRVKGGGAQKRQVAKGQQAGKLTRDPSPPPAGDPESARAAAGPLEDTKPLGNIPEEYDSDAEFGGSLLDRLGVKQQPVATKAQAPRGDQKTMKSPKAAKVPKPAPKAAAKATKAVASKGGKPKPARKAKEAKEIDDESDANMEANPAPKAAKGTKKRKSPERKGASTLDDDIEDSDEDLLPSRKPKAEATSSPEQAEPTKRAARPSRNAQRKAVYVDAGPSESESGFEDADGDFVDVSD